MFNRFRSALNFINNNGQRLYQAIQSSNRQEVFSILEGWFPPNYHDIRLISNEHSISPMILAFQDKKILRKLITTYIDQIPQIELNKSILECIRIDNVDAIIEFLACYPGFEPDQVFLKAATFNSKRICTYLFSKYHANIRSKHFVQAIKEAIKRKDDSTAHFILESRILKIIDPHMRNLFEYAAEQGKIDFIRYVLQKFDSNISDSTREVAISTALSNGFIKIVGVLMNVDFMSDADIIKHAYIDRAGKGSNLNDFISLLCEKCCELFSSNDKGIFLKLSAATSRDNRDCFHSLIVQYGDMVSPEDKHLAIKISKQIDEMYSNLAPNRFNWNLNSIDCLSRHTAFGHLEIIEFLLKHYSNKFSVLSKIEAFKVAIDKNHTSIIKVLLESIQVNAEEASAIKASVDKKYDTVFEYIFSNCATNLNHLDKEFALKIASYRGCEIAVKVLLADCASKMNHFNLRLAYIISKENGYQSISEMILQYSDISLLTNNDDIQIVIEASDAISSNAVSSRISFIPEHANDCSIRSHLLAEHPGTVSLILEQYSVSSDSLRNTLFTAAQHGCEPIVKLIFPKLITSGIPHKQIINHSFEMAATSGHLNIVDFLLTQDSIQILDSNVISASLIEAAFQGHYKIVERILEKYSDEITEWDKSRALMQAIMGGHPQTVNSLLNHPSIVQVAHFNDNSILHNAQHRLNGAVPDSEERARYEEIIRRLMQIPAVANLARQQQQNGEMDLAWLTQFDENSMRSMSEKQKKIVSALEEKYGHLYKNKNWEAIRTEILNYLKQQYLSSPALDGYHRVWMLPADGRIPADFMPADTLGLYIEGNNCELYWKEINGALNKKSFPKQEVVGLYELLSKECWLYQDSQDKMLVEAILKKFGVPHHPKQGHRLPIEFTKDLNESALVAYYRHPIHNAWRYLADTNPWMSPDARYVDNIKNRAILSDFDKALISYLWIAVNDENILLDEGFTIEGNKIIFAHTLGEINRGHNIDERPVYLEDQYNFDNRLRENIETTCRDNLLPDRPSCSMGVTQRLLQSKYGHPYTEARTINFDILLKWMNDHLIKAKEVNSLYDNLIDRLQNLSVRPLKAIQQHISDALELYEYDESDKVNLSEDESTQLSKVLSFSNQHIREFLIKLSDFFGQELIESCPVEKTNIGDGNFPSYTSFVQYCAENPLDVFSETIYKAVKSRINELEAYSLLSNYNQSKKRKKLDADDDQTDEEPVRKQHKPN